MRIAIISLAETTAAPPLILAVERAGMEALHFTEKENVADLAAMDGFILLSCRDEPSLLSMIKQGASQGKPVLGLGEGAVLLVNQGLIPGLPDNRAVIAVAENKAQGEAVLEVNFRLSKDYQYNAFTRYLTPYHMMTAVISTPCGRFLIPPGLLMEIEAQGLNVFCYCDAKGNMVPDIAALANKVGNVMAIVPYPKMILEWDPIILSMRDYIASGYVAEVAPLSYWPR